MAKLLLSGITKNSFAATGTIFGLNSPNKKDASLAERIPLFVGPEGVEPPTLWV